MKSRTKRIRMIRRLALTTGCFVALAVPAGASAMLPDGRPQQQQQDQQQYSLPAGWHSEVQTGAPQQSVKSFALHKGFRPEVQTQSPASATAPSPTVIRQIETVTDDSGKTLAIVLASIALANALCSLAYASIRVAQVQRREVQSH